MESKKILHLFLEFFSDRGHEIVSGSPLIPFDDPTLLFTNAGMVQFKKFWATEAPLSFARAVTCQKCMRAGGKDSDLEKIGVSGRHHTFFEMLGNFSFGDYFKTEAIEWAFMFVTERLKIHPDALWVSFHEKDRDTEKLWNKFMPENRIVPLGDADNFWGPAGDTGPCGPCTELYIDRGPAQGCNSECSPGCECGRFLEFWNIVFPQYDKQEDSTMKPLQRRGVDTGMGLERMASILQNTPSNYETDLFMPVIRELENISGHKYGTSDVYKSAFRVIADHIRAAVFLIDDNILPSNEGRGYVLRRILRRAFISGATLGLKNPFLFRLARFPAEMMKDRYPSLADGTLMEKVICDEEEKFNSLLGAASRNFGDVIGEMSGRIIPGEVAFKLYDTYGIPRDVITDLAAQRNMEVDWEDFNRSLDRQKNMSRVSSNLGSGVRESIFENKPLTETVFTGYEKIYDSGKIVAAYSKGKKELLLVMDKTPFYPEKGGQAGDKGVIENPFLRYAVHDTFIDEKGVIYHSGKLLKGSNDDLLLHSEVNASVDAEYRKKVSINHTATHLLHYALKDLLGSEVRQAGSYVGPDRLRFDFVCFRELSSDDIARVEDFVQGKIALNDPVSLREMKLAEALEKGVTALFLERYDDNNVRVIGIGGYHTEICGGTHVQNTGEILLFRITGFSSIGKNLKRVEAVTCKEAVNHFKKYREILDALAEKLEVTPDKIASRVEKLVLENDEKNKIIAGYEDKIAGIISQELQSKKQFFKQSTGNSFYFVHSMLNVDNGQVISKVSDRVISNGGEGIVLLGSRTKNKVALVIKVSPGLSEKFSAVNLMKDISSVLGGGGGGSPLFARGSGTEPAKFEQAAEKIRETICKTQGE